jgi:hypothetical protein
MALTRLEGAIDKGCGLMGSVVGGLVVSANQKKKKSDRRSF